MSEARFSHLADIKFSRIPPSSNLKKIVKWYWHISSRGPLHTTHDEFMHPDGSLGLVFNWGDELELNHGRYPQSAVIDSVNAHSKQLRLAGNVEMFGVLFYPGGAYPIFGVPISVLSESSLTTYRFRGSPLVQLHEQLYNQPTFEGKAALMETWLIQRLQEPALLSPLIQPSLKLIQRFDGQIPIKRVAEEGNVTLRHLERLYKEQVGLSPKKIARLFRVRRARAALKQPELQASHITYTCGFFDQAHFIREFKAVVGMTPGLYRARQREKLKLIKSQDNSTTH